MDGQEPSTDAQGANETSIKDLTSAMAVIKDLRAENAKARVAAKSIEEMQKELNELRTDKKAREEQESMKKGEYEKVIENNKKELEALKETKQELEKYKQKEIRELNELKGKLPEGLREKFKDNNNIEEIKAVIDFTANRANVSPAIPGVFNPQSNSLAAMNHEQIFELARVNPQAYEQLVKQMQGN